MATDKTSPEAIERQRQRARALELREQGVNYRDIALELGVTVATAHRYVKAALTEIIREPAEAVLDLELARHDEIQNRLRDAIINLGELEHAGNWLRISRARARLLGLDHMAIQKLDRATGNTADIDIWLAEMLGTGKRASGPEVDDDAITSVDQFVERYDDGEP